MNAKEQPPSLAKRPSSNNARPIQKKIARLRPKVPGKYSRQGYVSRRIRNSKNSSNWPSVFGLAAAWIEFESGSYENPIQRPPMPTPDHSSTETTATVLLQMGLSRASSPMTTLRCTLKVKTIARSSDAILNQKAPW